MVLRKRSFKIVSLLFLVGLGLYFYFLHCGMAREKKKQVPFYKAATAPVIKIAKPKHVKGIHITPWVAGTKERLEKIEALIDETELNTVVIAVKETQGQVFIPGVPLAHENGFYVRAVPNIRNVVKRLNQKGIYTIARIVVFKDQQLAQKIPDLSVKNPDGTLWLDYRKKAWVDPYRKEVWNYNINVATIAVELGFQEIQFDYVRYPSDGDTKQCRYSFDQHSSTHAALNLNLFLKEASRRIKPLGAKLSVDVFGLITSVRNGMGIGQRMKEMTEWVDYLSPMVYPSHYAEGQYGLDNPNGRPYTVVNKAMSDARKRMGTQFDRMRPFFQDFSLGHKYGPQEVRAQIQAAEEMDVHEWLLWNPSSRYSRSALKTKDGVLDESAQPPKSMLVKFEEYVASKSSDSVVAGSTHSVTQQHQVNLSTGNSVSSDKQDKNRSGSGEVH